MTKAELPHWERAHWEPGGGTPTLFYKLHGDFSHAPAVSRSKYRCEGPPPGLDVTVVTQTGDPPSFGFGLDDVFAGRLRSEHPALAAQVEAAPHAMIIRGEVADRGDLDYLRDTVGLIMAMLDGGGLAVFDPFILDWWTPEAWQNEVFDAGGPVPRHHALILVSEEEAGRKWIHTRGMRKFGRPDISVRGVQPGEMEALIDLCDRFIEMQAFGAVIAEGQPIRMKALKGDWACFHGGDLDDPDFNNVHVEIRRTG
jgi:hypothetical protein